MTSPEKRAAVEAAKKSEHRGLWTMAIGVALIWVIALTFWFR